MALVDTYITVAEADSYHTRFNPGSAWGSAATTDKEAAIRAATQYLETQYTFIGDIQDASQALAWPRVQAKDQFGNVVGINIRDKDGRALETPYPQQVMDACAELALIALDGTLFVSQSTKDDDIARVKAGSVEVEYNPYSSAKKLYPHVRALLRSVIEYSSSVNHKLNRVQ